MREILFRGKSKDKRKWVFGNLVYGFDPKEEAYIEFFRKLEDDSDELHFERISIAVDPETVGQYVGMNDRNGTKIFEGDIVRWWDTALYLHKIDNDGNPVPPEEAVFLHGRVDTRDNSYVLLDGFTAHHRLIDYSMKVIGNIHDNPEMV